MNYATLYSCAKKMRDKWRMLFMNFDIDVKKYYSLRVH